MTQAINMSPRQNASHNLAYPNPNIVDIRRLHLHRLVMRQVGPDKYLVGRAGARGAISTSALLTDTTVWKEIDRFLYRVLRCP